MLLWCDKERCTLPKQNGSWFEWNSVILLYNETLKYVAPASNRSLLCIHCLCFLYLQVIHAVNLGDSGFIVVREGSTIFQSPSQQHDFNYPYQLDAGGLGDLPKDAQVWYSCNFQNSTASLGLLTSLIQLLMHECCLMVITDHPGCCFRDCM